MSNNGNRGKYTPTPVTVTVNGQTMTWVGRGRKPQWLRDYETTNGPVKKVSTPTTSTPA